MEEAADMTSVNAVQGVEAVQGARYVLGVLPELDIYNIYVAPVLYYFEKKDGASLGVVRIALRGLVVAVLMLVVSLFGFLSMMNVACLCVTSLAMGVMEVKKKKSRAFAPPYLFFLLCRPSFIPIRQGNLAYTLCVLCVCVFLVLGGLHCCCDGDTGADGVCWHRVLCRCWMRGRFGLDGCQDPVGWLAARALDADLKHTQTDPVVCHYFQACEDLTVWLQRFISS